uniref:NADH-ubiquinone oxidoreductase chain 3 n=1 Tax=Nuttalliella namaqua TaxID=1029659 RepID=K7QMB8_9ACAR|nr:NADH dehydrogenase subunit 3 [Nuttalliella namaqua]AFV32084.1 NADH dehydrogenase subunit 3 [Nuttalliella namaqua]
MILILLIFMIVIIFFIILTLFKKLIGSNKEKNSPFECGFDPFSMTRIPFSIHFFTICIMFLIFDIEIIVIIPLPELLHMMKTFYFFITAIMVIFLILIGLLYEWKKGLIEWM